MSDDVFAWLRARAEREIETSCAWVYLLKDRALKVKKPVDFGFLDFSTLAKRRWALERELSFNRATAPDIYRALRTITRDTGGDFAFDGAGEAVECALEMRRFDPADVLSERPEAVDGALAEALGRTIARFHAEAPVRPEGGGVKALGYTIRTNAEHLTTLAARLGADEVRAVVEATDAAFAAASPLLEARRAQGFARHCHGDLHLGNILLEDGRPIPFDCIEFNDLLSEIDVLYDLAFLLMDLGFRGNGAAANRVLNAWLDEAARSFPPTIWDGLAALPLMQSARASVRAHVTANQDDDAKARAYLAEAKHHLIPAAPSLIAVGGVSGTGKTTLARLIAPGLGARPGAVIVRSDEVRKRLSAHPDYTPRAIQQAYDAMLAEARAILKAGHAAILDATHLEPSARAAARTLAADAGVPFRGVWLAGPTEVLEKRLTARRGDASDATADTLHGQLARDPGPLDWEVLDASDLSAAARRIGVRGGD